MIADKRMKTPDFFKDEMIRCFEAGRFSEARLNCRIWTRLVAAQKKDFFNDGASGPGWSADIRPAGMPSPYTGELRGE